MSYPSKFGNYSSRTRISIGGGSLEYHMPKICKNLLELVFIAEFPFIGKERFPHLVEIKKSWKIGPYIAIG